MRSPEKILVATDFSDCSLLALERASQLGQYYDAKIDLLHVYQLPPYVEPNIGVGFTNVVTDEPLLDVVRGQAEAELEAFLKRAVASGVVVRDSQLVLGIAATTILDVARDGAYDLIALGTHGRTGLPHLLMGSVAERVVRRADRPVLTVRQVPKTHAA